MKDKKCYAIYDYNDGIARYKDVTDFVETCIDGDPDTVQAALRLAEPKADLLYYSELDDEYWQEMINGLTEPLKTSVQFLLNKLVDNDKQAKQPIIYDCRYDTQHENDDQLEQNILLASIGIPHQFVKDTDKDDSLTENDKVEINISFADRQYKVLLDMSPQFMEGLHAWMKSYTNDNAQPSYMEKLAHELGLTDKLFK